MITYSYILSFIESQLVWLGAERGNQPHMQSQGGLQGVSSISLALVPSIFCITYSYISSFIES